MMHPEQKQNHGEMLDDGKDVNSGWTWDTLENNPAADLKQEL